MCKPTVRELRISQDGPCSFAGRSYDEACAAWSMGRSWRGSLANLLRRWADKAEGVNSISVIAMGPAPMTWEDALDAIAHGLNGATKYMNDLWRERTYVPAPEDPKPLLPASKIS